MVQGVQGLDLTEDKEIPSYVSMQGGPSIIPP